MTTALKSRKRKPSSSNRAPARPSKPPARASGAAAIPVRTKAAKAAVRADAAVLYPVLDYGAKPFTIDASGPTFGEDLKRAFEKNVAKARRENKKKFGSPDPQPSRR
jgi:hypothetical protein